MSFPSWERGLKFLIGDIQGMGDIVVPLVGTWIEILLNGVRIIGTYLSFPSWERGLKYKRV